MARRRSKQAVIEAEEEEAVEEEPVAQAQNGARHRYWPTQLPAAHP